MAEGLPYELAKGSVAWAVERCQAHVKLCRGQWSPAVENLLKEVFRDRMDAEQRVRAVNAMLDTDQLPNTRNLLAWAGAGVRERLPAQDDEGPSIEILPFSSPRAQAAFLEGWNRGRREIGKPQARTAKEAKAVMGSGFMGDLSRIMAAPDTRTVEQKLADDRYDPFGDEAAA